MTRPSHAHAGAPVAMTDAEREVLSYWSAFMVGVHVPFAFVRYCTGDWQAAAMLAQLFYWFRPDREGADKTTILIDGERFVARRHTQWEELMLSPFEAKRAAAKLGDLGLVRIKYRMFDGARTCHYRLEFDALKDRIAPTGGSKSAPTDGSIFAPTDERNNAPTGGSRKPPTGESDSAPTIKEEEYSKDYKKESPPTPPRERRTRASASAANGTPRLPDPFFDAFCAAFGLGDGGKQAGLAGEFSASCKREGATLEEFREFYRANKRDWGKFTCQSHNVTKTFLAWRVGKGYAGDPLAAIAAATGAPGALVYDPEDPTTWEFARRAGR